MKCTNKDCDNESINANFTSDENIEILDIERSESNFDEWDLIVKFRCKKCKTLCTYEQ
jgi:hypothetical protein